MNDEEFWKTRAEKYNDLNWATDKDYLKIFVEQCRLEKNHLVLDVGCGTGIVANAISPWVNTVIGIDTSEYMAEKNHWIGNKYFLQWDIRNKLFTDNIFDRISARQTFHHILKDQEIATKNCYDALKPNGRLVIAENVPPSDRTISIYTDIFKEKEERVVITEWDLRELMEKVGFTRIQARYHFLYGFSVRNWLECSGLPKEQQGKIMWMYKSMSPEEMDDYDLQIKHDDCLYTAKNVIVSGVKE